MVDRCDDVEGGVGGDEGKGVLGGGGSKIATINVVDEEEDVRIACGRMGELCLWGRLGVGGK